MNEVYVAQCWDDGLVEDIRLIEILRRYNVPATFNLNPLRPEKNLRKPAWVHEGYQSWLLAESEYRSVYEGFELASHGMMHLQPTIVPMKTFVSDAVDARKWIEDFFQREAEGFAWPNGTVTEEAADALKEAGFLYGRTVTNTDRVTACRKRMMLDSSTHFLNPDFRKCFETARKTDGAFYFWGHSCEMHAEKKFWDDFEANIAWICAQPNVKWCTVSQMVRHFQTKGLLID